MGLLETVVALVEPRLPSLRNAQKKNLSLGARAFVMLKFLLPYLFASHLQLAFVASRYTSDPLSSARTIFAANPGTLSELGVLPIICARIIAQILHGVRLFDADLSTAVGRRQFGALVKLFVYFIAAAQAFACVASGMYGDVGLIGGFLVFAQIFGWSIVTFLIDESVARNNGFGNAVNLIIAMHVSEVTWGRIFSMSSLSSALLVAISVFATGLVALAVGVGVRIVAPIKIALSEKPAGLRISESSPLPKYGIKALYSAGMPLLIVGAFVANALLASQVLARLFPSSGLVGLLGTWQHATPAEPFSRPISGAALLITPPPSLLAAVLAPFHTLYYAVFLLCASVLASEAWYAVSGASAHNEISKLATTPIVQDHPEIGLVVKGATPGEAVARLEQYIKPAVPFSGAAVAALAVAADLSGAAAPGTALVIAILIAITEFEAAQQVISRDPDAVKTIQAMQKQGSEALAGGAAAKK